MLSRVVDSLYWMSRYLERAEHTARLIDVMLHSMIDQHEKINHSRQVRLLEIVDYQQGENEIEKEPVDVAYTLTFDPSFPNSIVNCISNARENARQVREQISTEMWEKLNQLYLFIRNAAITDDFKKNPHEFYMAIKEGSILFQGLTDSTMSHSEGWHFIYVGRYMERVWSLTRLLDVHFKEFGISSLTEVPSDEYLDWVGLLKSCTAFEAFNRTFQSSLSPRKISAFIILDNEFPHSIRFCTNMIKKALEIISELTETKKFGQLNRIAGKLCATLDYSQIEEIEQHVDEFFLDIRKSLQKIHDQIYSTFIMYPIEAGM